MWNSVLLDDNNKWSTTSTASFAKTLSVTDESADVNNLSDSDDVYDWTRLSGSNDVVVQQTNYVDWNGRRDEDDDDDTVDFFHLHGRRSSVDGSISTTCTSADELFRNFVGDDGADRIEFYVNHLTMEGGDGMDGCVLAESMALDHQLLLHGNNDASQAATDNGADYRPAYPLLETIAEETLEELLLDLAAESCVSMDHSSSSSSNSPNSSGSGRWGWGWGWLNTSDDDSSSVIHVPVGRSTLLSTTNKNRSTMDTSSTGSDALSGIEVETLNDWNQQQHQEEEEDEQDDDEGDDGWSERDHEVPKKKRRIASSTAENEEDALSVTGSSRPPSVTESLIQFEALEKEMLGGGDEVFTIMEPVFRTSATSNPFQDDSIEDPEVFLDCSSIKSEDTIAANPSDEDFSKLFFNIAALAADAAAVDDAHETLKLPLSPVVERKSRSVENVDAVAASRECNRKEADGRSQSACDFDVSRESCDIPNERKEEEEEKEELVEEGTFSQGQTVVWNDATVYDDERELNREDDEEIEEDDDADWEPDGFLPSGDEEEYYDDEEEDSCSSGTDYSAERDDQLDDLNLGFHAGSRERSSSLARMRSFRSYDSLNLIDCCASACDGVSGSSHSTASSDSSSNSPMDRSSPEDHHHQQPIHHSKEDNDQRRRHHHSSRHRSAEALSEDSGYGDAAGHLWSTNAITTMATASLSSSPSSSSPSEAVLLVLPLGLPAPAATAKEEESVPDCSPPLLMLSTSAICPPDAQDNLDESSLPFSSLPLTHELLPEEEEKREEEEDKEEEGYCIRVTDEQEDEGWGEEGEEGELNENTGNEWKFEKGDEEEEDEDERGQEKEREEEEINVTVSALLLRRQPRCRPAPLSLKEAEEFLEQQQQKLIAGDGEQRRAADMQEEEERGKECGSIGTTSGKETRCGSSSSSSSMNDGVICINLECKMSHTSEFLHDTKDTATACGNAASSTTSTISTSTSTPDDGIRCHRTSAATDLEPSNFNPPNGGGSWSSSATAAVASTAHEEEVGQQENTIVEKKDEEEERWKQQQQHSLQSQLQLLAQGSGFIIPLPDAWNHKLPDAGQNVTCSSSSPPLQQQQHESSSNVDTDAALAITTLSCSSAAMDSAFYPAPVVLKRYGPRQEVEVYISQEQQSPQDEANSISNKSPRLDDVVASNAVAGIRGVHFSPVVSSVNWRESYLDGSEDSETEDDHFNDRNEEEDDQDIEDEDLDMELVVVCDGESTGSGPVPSQWQLKSCKQESNDAATASPQKVRDYVGADVDVVAPSPSTVKQVNPNPEPVVQQQQQQPLDVDQSPPKLVPTDNSNGNGKKSTGSVSGPGLFQRFSLSRLSARMSATFGRSDSKRDASSSSPPSPPPATTPADSKPQSTAINESSTNNKKEKNKSKSKKEAVVHPQPEPPVKKSDEVKSSKTVAAASAVTKEVIVKPESKRSRFFLRPFQRSSSTPPAISSSSSNVAASKKPEAISTTSSTSASVAKNAKAKPLSAAVEKSLSSNNDSLVAQQPMPTTSNPIITPTTPTPPLVPVNPPVAITTRASPSPALGNRSRSPTASPSPPPPSASSSVHHQQQSSSSSNTVTSVVSVVSKQSSSSSSATSPAAAKPPLPPRALQAQRKQYLVQQQSLDAAATTCPPPPVPMVSSAGLQFALQHFKESARMERERLANSVPDLAAPPTPHLLSTRPTSDCIDPGQSTTQAPPSMSAGLTWSQSQSQQSPTESPSNPVPSLPPRHPISSLTSRERARLAILTRACSVENAWNATASQAALNLSRRHIASSSGSGSTAATVTSQGHAGAGTSAYRPSTNSRSQSRPAVPGLLETNLDSLPFTGGYGDDDTDRSSCSNQETNLDELIQNLQQFALAKRAEYSSSSATGGGGVGGGSAGVSDASAATSNDKRFKSMLNLGSSNSAPVSVEPDINNMMSLSLAEHSRGVGQPYADPNRAKSMEFLLDEDNKTAVQVPENQLKKCSERQMSEHELRIQRSLQKINVPEWYKNNARSGYNSATSTGLLRRREYQPGGTGTGSSLRNGSLSGGGWAGLSQRDGTTSSMTSLGSGLSRSGTPTRVVIPTRVRPDWRNVKSSRESLISPDGTMNPNGAASLSLAATQQPVFSWSGPSSLNSTTGGQQQLQSPFPRWGSGRSSYSTCPSPSPSASSTLTTYRASLLNQHGRQPYLGWRSQEKLNSGGGGGPPPLSIYRTPAERLASSLKKSEAEHQQSPMSSPTAAAPVSCTATATITGPEADEIRSSIRQVTSAIVHYVSGDSDDCVDGHRDRRNGTRSPERHPLEALSRSPSPRRQRVWLESSFIGHNPPDMTTTTKTTTTTSISPTSSRNFRKTTAARPESPPSVSPPPQLPPSSNHRVNNQRPGELMA